MSILAFLSDITCGEGCWHAKEDVCHCSCNGKNHGILRTKDGTQPTRTAKIDGYVYELQGVDYRNRLYLSAEAINASYGCSRIDLSGTMRWHYTWRETDKAAPARIKIATASQRAKWKELEAFKDAPRFEIVALLWVRVDPPKVLYCQDDCSRCNQFRANAHYKQRRAKGEIQ